MCLVVGAFALCIYASMCGCLSVGVVVCLRACAFLCLLGVGLRLWFVARCSFCVTCCLVVVVCCLCYVVCWLMIGVC